MLLRNKHHRYKRYKVKPLKNKKVDTVKPEKEERITEKIRAVLPEAKRLKKDDPCPICGKPLEIKYCFNCKTDWYNI